jgi:hypothetical protein
MRTNGLPASTSSGLSDVEHELMERDDHQHDQPKNITRNIGIKRPDEALVAVRLQFLFRRCLQHGRPAGLEREEGMVEQRIVQEDAQRETYKSQEGRCGCCMASTELTGLGPRCGRVYGSGDSMRKVSDYRKHAEECRKLMRGAKTPEHREMLHQMAETWESLAESREKQLQRRANSDLLRDSGKGSSH